MKRIGGFFINFFSLDPRGILDHRGFHYCKGRRHEGLVFFKNGKSRSKKQRTLSQACAPGLEETAIPIDSGLKLHMKILPPRRSNLASVIFSAKELMRKRYYAFAHRIWAFMKRHEPIWLLPMVSKTLA
ncbi:hypothetical protein VNO77_33901 [Canavalia gladiata]|uniref:Uncharacterized protein n=1 Tax=Canavalia gladiata TaxID=3824 RepID=A0AAN9KDD1_CANGL